MKMKITLILSFLVLSIIISITYGGHIEELQTLKMATTTSTADTGLLDYLQPIIEKEIGIELKFVAVGTGKALEFGKNCDVDILMVHDPEAEEKFIKEGHGIDRKQIMYNDFIVIGPKSDPAKIKGKSVKEAFKLISGRNAVFASRGDKSGTHQKEKLLWKESGISISDKDKWYLETGQGMMNTIIVAEERDAYILADRGTYIKYAVNKKDNPLLVILVEGDASLRNQYSVIAVNPAKCKDVKYELVKKFTNWIISPNAQKTIGDFKMMGKQLFIPNAETQK